MIFKLFKSKYTKVHTHQLVHLLQKQKLKCAAAKKSLDSARTTRCRGAVGGAYPWGPPSESRWPLRRVSIKIQKKKTVTEKVYIFTDKDCDPYVTDPSTRQGGRPITSCRNCLTIAKIWSRVPQGLNAKTD
jgi:hypothetical protein